MTPIIEISDLKKYYRSGIRSIAVEALGGISLSVDEGEVFGLIGPNGAGKSTAIKIILGLIKESSGTCAVFGEKISSKAKEKIGYMPENPYFYRYLTGLELVSFYAKLCGMTSSRAKDAALRALRTVGLSDAANRRLSLYSKGMVQRAGLAQAIVHDPKLVVLDEPASGLDPIGAADMAQTVLKLKSEGKTVLLCSHMMSEVEKLCSRAAILYRGKIAASGELDELLSIQGRSRLDIDNADSHTLDAVSEYARKLGANVVKTSAAKISLDEFFRKTVETSK